MVRRQFSEEGKVVAEGQHVACRKFATKLAEPQGSGLELVNGSGQDCLGWRRLVVECPSVTIESAVIPDPARPAANTSATVHSYSVRICHWINVVACAYLLWSGVHILLDFPE